MPKSTTTSKRQRTSDRAIWIENAAVRCFLTNGYESTSISDIMARANQIAEQNNVASVTDGAFYSLFDSKQAIIETILERDAKQLINAIATFSNEANFEHLDLFSALEAAHETLGTFYNEHKNYIAVLFSVTDLPSVFSTTKDHIGYELTTIIKSFLEKEHSLQNAQDMTIDSEDLEIITGNILVIFENQHRLAIDVVIDQSGNLVMHKSDKKWNETMRIIRGYLKEYLKDSKTSLQPWEELAMLEFQKAQQTEEALNSLPLSSYLFFHHHFRKLAQEDNLTLASVQELVNQMNAVTEIVENGFSEIAKHKR